MLDKGLGGKESVVFFSKLLDKLLVLVQPIFKMVSGPNPYEIKTVLFQIINRHVLQFYLLCPIDISGVGENANRHARTGDIRKSKYSRR